MKQYVLITFKVIKKVNLLHNIFKLTLFGLSIILSILSKKCQKNTKQLKKLENWLNTFGLPREQQLDTRTLYIIPTYHPGHNNESIDI